MMDDYPSAFFNRNGELVGFDAEMTHQFARQLDLKLVFLPVSSITEGGQRVNTSYCDVFMSLLPITPELTERVAITSPVLKSALGMVVADHLREQFQTWGDIRKMKRIRIAVSDTPAVLNFLAREVPNATAVSQRVGRPSVDRPRPKAAHTERAATAAHPSDDET